MMRTTDALELLSHFPNAFRLACFIAIRCRWRSGFNAHGLDQGECWLGDWRECGFSEKEYRWAKSKLENLKFAAFKRAGRGTVARLLDARLFDTSPTDKGGIKGGIGAGLGRDKGGIRATNEEGKKERLPSSLRVSRRKDRGTEPAEAWTGDGYVEDKLCRNPKLLAELKAGKTTLSIEFAELWLLAADKARELIGSCVEARRPGAWLNKAVSGRLKEESER
jgi:hypothetical protein